MDRGAPALRGAIFPEAFGDWNSVRSGMLVSRWSLKGVWRRIFEKRRCPMIRTLKYLIVDSTIVRAHQHAGVGAKKKGSEDQAPAPLRGGLSTKIHVWPFAAWDVRRAVHAFDQVRRAMRRKRPR